MHCYKSITILLILLTVSGCAPIKTAVAMMQSTDRFTLHSEGRGLIYREIEFSPLAEKADKYLDKSIDTVEAGQYGIFVKPVKVYAVSTLDNMENYCGYRLVLGCVINEKVFLSPRILTQPNGTLARLLTHELSHLHIDQQLSMLEWATVPTWFREGLAVYVSTKIEGAAKLDFNEAKAKIRKRESFYPNESGSLLFPKSHTSFGLSRSIFYRQAAFFVKFLQSKNKKDFKKLLRSIQKGNEFSASFKNSFGVPIDSKWNEFIGQI